MAKITVRKVEWSQTAPRKEPLLSKCCYCLVLCLLGHTIMHTHNHRSGHMHKDTYRQNSMSPILFHLWFSHRFYRSVNDFHTLTSCLLGDDHTVHEMSYRVITSSFVYQSILLIHQLLILVFICFMRVHYSLSVKDVKRLCSQYVRVSGAGQNAIIIKVFDPFLNVC